MSKKEWYLTSLKLNRSVLETQRKVKTTSAKDFPDRKLWAELNYSMDQARLAMRQIYEAAGNEFLESDEK